MQTQWLTSKPFRFHPTFALTNGILLLALSSSAQAQVPRSRPSPPAPGPASATGNKDHSNKDHSSGPSAHTSSKSSSHGERGSGESSPSGSAAARGGSAVSHGGRVKFAVLFPVERRSPAESRSGVKTAAPPRLTYTPRLPGIILAGGDIFDSTLFPKLPDDPTSSKESDDKKSEDKTSEKGKTGDWDKTGAESSSSQRYKDSQEASAAQKEHNTPDRSQILWPDRDRSPFWAYSVDEVFWWPSSSYGGSPDGSVLYPTPGRVIIKGWPNYELQATVPRDEPSSNYRIGEKTLPKRPVDLQPALDDIQRAFQEEQPRLLASHLVRAESLALNKPGHARQLVSADMFLKDLATLFMSGKTITVEFDEPQMIDSDLFAVTAWWVFQDPASTVYRLKIRLVLQAHDNRVILTAFEMD